ncbi:MAG TPA: type II toxin-antitoxin system VapC family toxin [Nitrospiraceae bacterium]|nr:type II toxin-antitoxin system VapC family toxin [Nitrospiraceae bacterium]
MYLDAGALVKAYAFEPGTEEVVAWHAQAEMVSTSKVAYIEVLTTLYRKRRAGEMSDGELSEKIEAFIRHWEAMRIVDLSDELLQRFRNRAMRSGPRALDLIHLASALLLQDYLTERVQFVCADRRLNEAAAAEGLSVRYPSPGLSSRVHCETPFPTQP